MRDQDSRSLIRNAKQHPFWPCAPTVLQAKWSCGKTAATNGFIDLSRLCGTASYTQKSSWLGGCFERCDAHVASKVR